MIDINFFCCDGEVLFCVVTEGEKTGQERIAYFTPEGGRILAVEQEEDYERDWLPPDYSLPRSFAEGVRIASQLSADIDFVRVDLMCTADATLYACEMNPLPSTGPYMNTRLVQGYLHHWDIRNSWFLKTPQTGFKERYRQALNRQLDRMA